MVLTNSPLRLYECFCDIRVTKCWLWATDDEGEIYPSLSHITRVTSVSLEIHITSVSQEREPGAVKETYSNYILCSTENFLWAFAVCRRLKWDGDICETYACMEYSVDTNLTSCSYPCNILLWPGYYDLEFSNLGEVPVRDGVCPVNPPATSPFPNTTAQETKIFSGKVNDSIDDLGNATDFGRGNKNETGSFDSGVTYLGVGGGILFLVVAALGLYRYIRGSKRKRNDEGNPVSFGHSPSSSELSRVDSGSVEATSLSREDLERVMYQTLGEVTDDIEGQSNVGGVDEQGYDLVRNCDKDDSDECTVTKGCRPLPRPPESGNQKNCSLPETSAGARAAKSSSTIKSKPIATLDASNLRSPDFSSKSTQPSNPRSQSPLKSQRLADTTLSKAFPSAPPRPHKRLVDLKDHKSMGLVKLRQDQAVFGDVTEVKLIRTLTGHLELVNLEEELPAFVEYYTKLLIINQKQGSTGVVGLLNTHEDLRSEEKLSQPLPPNRVGGMEFNNSEMMASSSNAYARYSDTVDKPNPSIIYFGSLSLDEDVSVQQCDYLTVLDIDPSDTLPDSDGYLTILDTDNMTYSTNSHISRESPYASYNLVTEL